MAAGSGDGDIVGGGDGGDDVDDGDGDVDDVDDVGDVDDVVDGAGGDILSTVESSMSLVFCIS